MTDEAKRDGRRVPLETKQIVSAYLAVVRTPKRRGRRRTLERVNMELATCQAQIADESTSALDLLKLHQQVLDLTAEQEAMTNAAHPAQLEDRFVEVAAQFGEAKGISYDGWRSVGVEAAVLKRAGISPQRG